MTLRALTIFTITLLLAPSAFSQRIIRAADLFGGGEGTDGGMVQMDQAQSIDSLLSRHILANKNYNGFEGFRIQIFSGSGRTAREMANEARARFISEFPQNDSYLNFEPPNYFKVRIGDYRTKRDAYNDFLAIKKEFPDAYIVPDRIIFPDLDK